MPAITRTARALALAAASLGLTVTAVGATSAPVHAETGTRTTASTTSAKTTAKAAARKRTARRVLSAKSIAMNQRGDAYAYGAAGPNAFDCSGLIYYSYRKAGFAVPRTSSDAAGASLSWPNTPDAPSISVKMPTIVAIIPLFGFAAA